MPSLKNKFLKIYEALSTMTLFTKKDSCLCQKEEFLRSLAVKSPLENDSNYMGFISPM